MGFIADQEKRPILVYYPDQLSSKVHHFKSGPFDQICYPVKANNDPYLLQQLGAKGIRAFDVASLNEIENVLAVIDRATFCFSHPIKDSVEISTAFYRYGVRDFVVDTDEELRKIRQTLSTSVSAKIRIHVRISVSNKSAKHPLDGKFGAGPEDAARLLCKVDGLGYRTGISFHAGSQNIDPSSFLGAIDHAYRIAGAANVTVGVLNIGGGFPVKHTDDQPLDLGEFFSSIRRKWTHRPREVGFNALWCEPGRALVAEAGSLILRIEQRRGDVLYVNDGVYGCLHDGKFHNVVFPCRELWNRGVASRCYFTLQGPTCDSVDCLPYQISLPCDAGANDRIEVLNVGAYGHVLATAFNGKQQYSRVAVNAGAEQDLGVECRYIS